MLVEINLLPKKEPRNISFVLIFSAVILLFIGLITFFYFQYTTTQSKLDQINDQLQTTRELIMLETAKQADAENNSSIQTLNELIKWTEDYPIKTVPLIKHFISLLPERGFFMNFAYSKEGIVTLSVQFDYSRESAFYLSELIQSKYISEAKLLSLITSFSDEEDNKEQTEDQVGSQNEKTTAPQLDSNPYLPRYLATYELKLNHKEIKKLEEEIERKRATLPSPSPNKGGEGN